jgi:hypothetical protein
MSKRKIFHSSQVGGLVPLEGWYWLLDDDFNGPFASEAEARADSSKDAKLPEVSRASHYS